MKKNLCETFCNSEKLTLSFKVGKIVLQWGPPVFLLEGALSGVHCSGSTIDNEAKSVVKERASTRQRSLEGRWIMTRHWREPFQNHNAWPLDLTTHPLWHKVKPCHCGGRMVCRGVVDISTICVTFVRPHMEHVRDGNILRTCFGQIIWWWSSPRPGFYPGRFNPRESWHCPVAKAAAAQVSVLLAHQSINM